MQHKSLYSYYKFKVHLNLLYFSVLYLSLSLITFALVSVSVYEPPGLAYHRIYVSYCWKEIIKPKIMTVVKCKFEIVIQVMLAR